jgi:glycosyltransferase involved in cell wall biosynthesis
VTVSSCRQEGGRRALSPLAVVAPLVSIIVVVFRAPRELSSLLESIFTVQRPEVEVIVIDGGSGDGTVELLRKWSDRIDYWLSEPDTGIYNAMNKGLAAATGHYVLHLNAGDALRFVPSDALRQCLVEEIDVVSCRVRINDSVTFCPSNGPRMLIENAWHHQGTFYRRLGHPGYDETYRVFGDFDLNQKLAKRRKSIRFLNEIVADHKDGISVSGRKSNCPEVWRSVRTNSGIVFVPIAFAWYKLYFVRRWIATFRRLIARQISSPAR